MLFRLEVLLMKSPAPGMSVFIDNLLDVFRRYPQLFRIIALNKTQSEETETLPGYHLIQGTVEASVKKIMEKIPMVAQEFEVVMLCRTFMNHFINYLGSAKFHASVMNLEPDSIQNMNWVKDAALFIFLPRMEMMLQRNDDGND